MEQGIKQRWVLAAVGGLAGLSLYLLLELLAGGALPDRLALALAALVFVFFTALLALIGPLTVRRALGPALVQAVVVAGLLALAAMGFDTVEGLFDRPVAFLATLVLTFLPLPFAIAALRGNWRDYPVLFTQAWSICVRYISAWTFTGLVWLVLFLSHELLSLVGIEALGDMLETSAVAATLTGAVLGLSLAVVTEFSDLVSPALVLRLIRLLAPVVLAVLAVFLLALPFRGLSGLFGGLSSAAVLLSMAALVATLVTTAIDESDIEATDSPLLVKVTQGLALILLAPAALGAWAVALRVAQYGWTPDRVFAAVVAVLGLGYGLAYPLAVLRGRGWMARIRAANVWMALALVVAAAALLTPILSPERIAASSQLARVLDGRTPPDRLDAAEFNSWGRPGAAALAMLEARAAEPGQTALAEALARGEPLPQVGLGDAATQAARKRLAEVMAVRPADARLEAEALIAALEAWEVDAWLADCDQPAAEGTAAASPACVLLLAEFLPDLAGREMVALRQSPGGEVMIEGFALVDGQRRSLQAAPLAGGWPDPATLDQALADILAAELPPTRPVTLYGLRLGPEVFVLRP